MSVGRRPVGSFLTVTAEAVGSLTEEERRKIFLCRQVAEHRTKGGGEEEKSDFYSILEHASSFL